MTRLASAFKALVKDEEGATMVEYALMLALIAIVCIGAVTAIGTAGKAKFNESATELGGTAAQ